MEKEKVALPIYVCRWVDKCKKEKLGIVRLLQPFRTAEGNKIDKWINRDPDKHYMLLAQAWNYGFKIKNEQQYRVRFDNGMFLAMDVDGSFFITNDVYGKNTEFDIEELEEIDKLIADKAEPITEIVIDTI